MEFSKKMNLVFWLTLVLTCANLLLTMGIVYKLNSFSAEYQKNSKFFKDAVGGLTAGKE